MSEHTTPEWMTEEWLQAMAENSFAPLKLSMAKEILRLRAELAERNAFIASLPNLKDAGEMCKQAAAELAKVTAERDFSDAARVLMANQRDAARAELACKGCGGTVGDHLAPDQGGCPGRFAIDGVTMVPAAHVDAARAEVERLTKRVQSMGSSMEHHVATQTARLTQERDAAIRDRDDERERFNLLSQRCSVAEARRSELREALEQAQGEAEHALGGPRESLYQAIRELRDDRNEAVAASEAARRIWEADEDAALAMGKPAKMTQAEWVREFAASEVERFALEYNYQPVDVPLTLAKFAQRRAAELRKAAGAAAPVIIDEAPGATPPDVEPVVASGKVVEFRAPPADARQPDIDRLLDRWRDCQNEADSTELAIDHTDADAARRAIHDAIAARLAASEKAKADLLAAVRKQSADLRKLLETGRPTVCIHRQMLIQALIEPIEAAAERGPAAASMLMQSAAGGAAPASTCSRCGGIGSLGANDEFGCMTTVPCPKCAKPGAAAPVDPAGWEKPGTEHWIAPMPAEATPPADRQPAGEAKVRVLKVTQTGEHFCEHFCEERKKLAEVERREAEGVKLFDDLLANERAKVATMTIEIDAMRNRLAASEKAKRELVNAVYAHTGKNENSMNELIGAVEAAERAGGATGAAAPAKCFGTEVHQAIIDEAPGATLPDVEPAVASGKVVEFRAPAADARQPDDDPHMFSSDGRHHPDKGRMVVGFIVPQQVADEVRSLRARLAASEKAKAELLERIGSASTWVQWASADLRRATADAAERAGGAS